MLEMIRTMLFDPRPPRYIGRHRAANGTPVISIGVRRPRSASY